MKQDDTRIISRRDFLKLLGVATGSAAAGQFLFCESMAVSQKLLDRVSAGSGKESWANTVCGQCPGGCGISVRRIDGIPVYIKGNPMFPVNRGGVCPMAHSAMEVLFNPDRVKKPLKRSGTKGKGAWEDTDWDGVQTFLAERIRTLVAGGEGHKIAMINGDHSPLMRAFCQYWMKAVGSPNYFEDEMLIENSVAVRLSQGIDETPAYDLANSRYILNFGSNFLEEGLSPVHYQQIFGHLRGEGRETRATLVHIGSRMNLTGSNSDRWVPIRPGTYGALALGIAHVLIVDNLHDADFIRENTFGFTSFQNEKGREHIGFESFVRANYYPEKVSDITGVPTETIIQLGEQFGIQKPAVAISGDASRYATNGGFTQWSVYCLNALAGNIQKKGGVYFTPMTPEFGFTELAPDSRREEMLSQPKVGSNMGAPAPFGDVTIDQFAHSVLAGDPGQVDILIVVASNPAFYSRQKDTFTRALQKIENVICLGLFIDETARHSDLILPDHSFLEKTDISGPMGGLTFSHVGLQRPIMPPVFNTRQSGDVLLELGKMTLGGDIFPWEDYREIVRQRLEVIYSSGEGVIISESSDAEWIRYLKERGWKFQQYETFESFEDLVIKNGGWWNPVDPTRPTSHIFRTKSKKFEFVSSILEQRLAGISQKASGNSLREKQERLLSGLHISARGDDLLLPHHEPLFSRTRAEEFPLLLTVSELLTNRGGKGASQPSVMEMIGVQVGRYWMSWIEINPTTAQEYGMKDRQLARVESAKGRIQAEVRYFQGIRPGIVHLHLGLGHTSYGQFGTGIGVNATDLIENDYDSLSNTPALNGTRVRVGPVLTRV